MAKKNDKSSESSTTNAANGDGEVLRLPAEVLFADQLEALRQNESDSAPLSWKLAPRSVLTYIIGGKPLTIYSVHFKSMGSPRNGLNGRDATMPIRVAEAKAVRRIIEDRFGKDHAAEKRWVICGDMNDYQERLVVEGDRRNGYTFRRVVEDRSALDVFTRDGFAENPVEKRPEDDRWTLYHNMGPQDRHLCQLDYILLSPALARRNHQRVPEIIRAGQPYRTVFPPGIIGNTCS